MRQQHHRYFASSNHQSSSSSDGVAVAAKTDSLVVTKAAPAIAMNVTTQIKTVASLFANLVKSSAPSMQESLSKFSKNITFSSNEKTRVNSKDGIQSEEAVKTEVKTTGYFPSYFDLWGRNAQKVKTEAAPTVPQWKVKRKTITQESIDARTKHCIQSVANAVTQPSLLVRLEDFCQHLFNYPQSKSLAARVNKFIILTVIIDLI